MGMLRSRKGLAGLVIAALGATVLLAGPPAGAASAGTVTVSYAAFVYSVTPGGVSGDIGDTFTLANTLTSGNNDPAYYVSLKDSTGQVSLGMNSCLTDSDCQVLDKFAGNATGIFTILGYGTVDVMRVYNNGAPTKIGTILLSGTGPIFIPPQSLYTATAEPNGGVCTGTRSWTRIPGNAAFAGVFTLPTAAQCTRTGYTLLGWATTADATRAAYAPGAEYSMSNADVTLYAVWRPVGVQVVYDANVGLGTQCIAGGRNLVTAAERQSTAMVVDVGSATATAAPCSPTGPVLTGWALTGDGASIVAPGAALPASLTGGTSVTLYAKWAVPVITFNPDTLLFSKGANGSLTVKVTGDGVPIRGAVVTLTIPYRGPLIFPLWGWEARVTTNEKGEASEQVFVDNTGSATVTAAIGNVTATATATITQSTDPTITIVGSRTTVSGKPGVQVDGKSTGLPAGSVVVPWVRFPGQTEYTQGTARPEVSAAGDFSWSRKTGKKVYVYFATEDGKAKSNLVVIPAN